MMLQSLEKRGAIEEIRTFEGLSSHEAQARLSRYGKNCLPREKTFKAWKTFLLQFHSVLIYVLLVASLFSLVIKHYVDFFVIASVIVINSLIGFFQQYRAEKTIDALQGMLVTRVRVVRDGKVQEVDSETLVPGDLVLLASGSKIMADCRLIKADELQTNESVLTGESLPVDKSCAAISKFLPLAERTNMVYMGTSVVRGEAKAIVMATGRTTEFGKIAGMVQHIAPSKTPLEKKLDDFSAKLSLIVLFFGIVLVAIGLTRGEELLQLILSGIALAISVIPEGLPAVIAIALAFAIQRMHKHHALIRKLPAAETLGRTTVICTDKTGTLTEGDMRVEETYYSGKVYSLRQGHIYDGNKKADYSEGHKKLFEVGVLCNNARAEYYGNHLEVLGEPTEKALVLSAINAGIDKRSIVQSAPKVKEYAFTSGRKMMAIVRSHNGHLTSYVKGAPDVVLARCTHEYHNGLVRPLKPKRREELLEVYRGMAGKALRVLAFAYKEIHSMHAAEEQLTFIGYQGLMDPPRKEIYGAIRECKSAGIRIKMITGDSALTACAISRLIGLEGKSIEGKDLEILSAIEFANVVRNYTVFARITPELKLRIVQTLRDQDEVVAVTGDGVNDILALKEAHVGIAMGSRGTDATREAADIILLDDNFKTIVSAVREGRRVYANLEKSVQFHLSANFSKLFLVITALFFFMPLPLLPLAILWMNLVTESFPSLALSVEPVDNGIMRRKPIRPNETVLGGIWKFMIIAGILSFIMMLSVFLLTYEQDIDRARTLAVTTTVFFEMFIAFSSRSKKPVWQIGLFTNRYLVGAVALGLGLHFIALYTALGSVFSFVPLPLFDLAGVFSMALLGFIILELAKAKLS